VTTAVISNCMKGAGVPEPPSVVAFIGLDVASGVRPGKRTMSQPEDTFPYRLQYCLTSESARQR
jgi:hypothetical protein